MKQPNPILTRIMPFLMIAFAIIIFVLALFVFSYVLIAAIVIGLIVFIVQWIRVKFFGYRKKTPRHAFHESFFIVQTNITDASDSETKKHADHSGRIIEHEEQK